MQSDDTIKLLRECDAGTQMAVDSIDQVMEHVADAKLERCLAESKARHSEIGNRIHTILNEAGEQGKSPNPIAEGMSWVKTGVMVGMDESDATVADVITDGCDMGVKSLNRYLNQYGTASAEARRICTDLIAEEETLGDDLKQYL